MEWNEFCNKFKDNLQGMNNIEVEINEDYMNIMYNMIKDKKVCFRYTKENFLEDTKEIVEVDDKFSIVNEKFYETPIFLNDSRILTYIKNEKKIYTDNDNNLEYSLDVASNLFYIKAIENDIKPNYIIFYKKEWLYEENDKNNHNIEELFHLLYSDILTLKIYSQKKQKKDTLKKLANAFIFDNNYNTDLGAKIICSFEKKEENLNLEFRKNNIGTMQHPKRIYKEELLEQYNMASITNEPFIKYLCYYHILECYYERVYKEELIEITREKLTSPSFSTKSDDEIMKIINCIKSKIKSNKEDFDGNELEALELVIKKYTKIDDLKKDIKNVSSELFDYYNREKVNFSKGNSINFNDENNVFKNIANRIYSTRNALVHYKTNELRKSERGIYSPFKDKDELYKEIPLIRLLAEKVILGNSKLL